MIYLVENDYYSAYVVSYDIVLFCPLKAFMPGDNKTVELGVHMMYHNMYVIETSHVITVQYKSLWYPFITN